MTEKVLGFKKKDVLHGYPMEDGGEIVIKLNKLVPVVSLQALKEKIRERERKIWEGTQTLLAHEGDGEKLEAMKEVAKWELNNIYSWAKIQGGEKRE